MIIKCFAQDSLSNYTQSVFALQTASGSPYLATPTPLSHSSPLLEIVFRLTNTRAKATGFCSPSPTPPPSVSSFPPFLSSLTDNDELQRPSDSSPLWKQSVALVHPGQRETSICRGRARGGPGCQPIRERPWRPFVRTVRGDEWRRTMQSVETHLHKCRIYDFFSIS